MNETPVYKIVTIPKLPFIIYDAENNKYSGMLIDLLEEISKHFDFKYTIYPQTDTEYGYMNDNGDWNGLIKELMDKRADIGLAAVSLMSERMRVVDFTEPIYEPTGISVLMRKQEARTAVFRFLTVLEVEVWLCIIGAYLFTSTLLWFFDTWSPYSYRNSKEKYKDDREKRIFTLKESLWFCLTSLTPQGGGEAPRNLSGKLVAATWWLFGFIIIASYTANLAAYLTISKIEKNIETFEDLIAQYRYTYTVIENSDTYRYFQRMRHIENKCYEFSFLLWKDMTLNDSLRPYERAQLAVWEYPLSDKYTKIFSAITHHTMVKNFSEGLKKLKPADSKFALITEATDVKYQVMTSCNYKEIGPEFSQKPFAIALQKNSPLTKKFNEVILRLTEENRLQEITDKWWKFNPNRQNCLDLHDPNNGIILENIGGVFILIAIGIGIAISTLVYEYLYYNYFSEKFDKFYTRKMEKLKSIMDKKSRSRRNRSTKTSRV